MQYKLKIFASVLVAAALWFVLFSPFTAPYVPFWTGMVVADIVLITLTVLIDGSWTRRIVFSWKNLLLGVIIAAVLWGVFFVGDKLSQLMFSFARPQVDSIYGMKDESDLWRIGISLFLLIGPVEEIFWRGFVQKNLSDFYSDNVGFILTLLFYTAIHIPSGNFM
ncbi:MAG: CPBP family intramembrane glutamic endopeptidase, partial [Bacteroidales bacterium]|nr:CPBP family intramembrane glutamic endopeptidase [Bacteroidales bacterium]